jgi:hypothetical protein
MFYFFRRLHHGNVFAARARVCRKFIITTNKRRVCYRKGTPRNFSFLSGGVPPEFFFSKRFFGFHPGQKRLLSQLLSNSGGQIGKKKSSERVLLSGFAVIFWWFRTPPPLPGMNTPVAHPSQCTQIRFLTHRSAHFILFTFVRLL